MGKYKVCHGLKEIFVRSRPLDKGQTNDQVTERTVSDVLLTNCFFDNRTLPFKVDEITDRHTNASAELQHRRKVCSTFSDSDQCAGTDGIKNWQYTLLSRPPRSPCSEQTPKTGYKLVRV